LRVEPYLYFQGRCEEALGFYRDAIGAEAAVVARFSDIPGSQVALGAEDKVAHAMLRVGGTTVLASDGQGQDTGAFAGFSLSLTTADDAEAEQLFAALAEGGTVQVPLMTTPFSSRMGIVADRFGVPWTVVTETAPPSAQG
jgi:PhnB protein